MEKPRQPKHAPVKFERKKPAAPEIRLSPTRPPSSSASRITLLGIGLLLVLGAIGVWIAGQRPDPHYIRAKDMVDDYARSRPEETRNYANPIYQEALAELALVPPKSVSYDDAFALARQIRAGRERLEARMNEAEQTISRRREEKRLRDLALFAQQQHSRLHPVTEYPECDE